jgi:hypothetical protein
MRDGRISPLLADWGFDFGAIEPPGFVWPGSEDRFVPYAHGRRLAANLPGAVHARPLDGRGLICRSS